MGNTIGTICFTKSIKDDEILSDLNDLRIKYNLAEADQILMTYKGEDYNYFGVSIDGLNNLIYSKHNIKAFLFDAEKLINNYNYSKVENNGEIPYSANDFESGEISYYSKDYVIKRNNLNILIDKTFDHLPY
jgi:hypothetical protein